MSQLKKSRPKANSYSPVLALSFERKPCLRKAMWMPDTHKEGRNQVTGLNSNQVSTEHFQSLVARFPPRLSVRPPIIKCSKALTTFSARDTAQTKSGQNWTPAMAGK